MDGLPRMNEVNITLLFAGKDAKLRAFVDVNDYVRIPLRNQVDQLVKDPGLAVCQYEVANLLEAITRCHVRS